MSRETNKKLFYVQRLALSVLVLVLFVVIFVVTKNPAKAQLTTNSLQLTDNGLKVKRIQVGRPLLADTDLQQSIMKLTDMPSPYDVVSDDSFQRYLSADTPFANIDYVPVDLQAIDSNFTANSSKRFFLRQEAGVQFADLAWHFWDRFAGDKLRISSAYRSNDFQELMLKKGCTRARCAQAGTSEHQAGLAIDLKVITKGGRGYALASGNQYYQWLADNAHFWGFHNTYQKGIDVDGQMVEGWHWRYVGVELATELHDKGLTFAEYYKINSKF